jgi:hypothetical protein
MEWNMDSIKQFLSNIGKQSAECKQPCQPDQSDQSNNECGSDTDCLGCAPFACAKFDPNSNHYIGDAATASAGSENGIISKHY